MRKLSLFVCSGLALLGMFGLQAQVASAYDPEPDCAGKSADVQGFHYGTVNKVGRATSLVYEGAALCGSNIDAFGNVTKGYKTTGYMLTPGGGAGGVTMHCANPSDSANTAYRQTKGWCQGSDLANKSYTGSAGIDFIVCLSLDSLCSWYETMSTTYVNDAGTFQGANRYCKPADKTVVQCLQATDPTTGLWATNITVQPCSAIPANQCRTAKQGVPDLDPYKDRYLIKTYEIQPLIGGNVYLTEIGEPGYNHTSEPSPRDSQLCEFAGDPGTTSCGSNPANWIQKNPPAGTYGCSATKPEGAAMRAIGWGGLVPHDKCYPVTWTP